MAEAASKRRKAEKASVAPTAVARPGLAQAREQMQTLDAVFAKQSPPAGAVTQPPARGGQADKENSEPAGAPVAPVAPAPERSVEEIYQKKSQLEHILLRPDSYVGSTERHVQDHWVMDDATSRMAKRKIEYVPALFKIFDEILVNAADNLVRAPAMDAIRIEINRTRGFISVWNNGSGLPVHLHAEHGCYVPELVFGHLLTSDNYDDSEKKVVGGRNGYGAKLTNIFSVRFVVETADAESGKMYEQTWERNMTTCYPPKIREYKRRSFTRVTFHPDFARFGMQNLEEDIVALMRRRAYDVAAATHGRCQVHLNGEALAVHSMSDYVDLHLEPGAFKICQTINERWEVGVGLVQDGSGFQQVSFVNSISTSRGGTHVDYVTNQVINAVLDKTSKQKSGALAIKKEHVKGYLFVFINCLIENPAFDSQTKETLTSKRERFGSTCILPPEEFINPILESGIVEMLQKWSKTMGESELAKWLNKSDLGMQKRLFGVPKLDDANLAGTADGGECTLILTEGDSAKALAVSGLSIVGRDRYGVFPLRGKLRNVRDLTVEQMRSNKEIEAVMKILALDASKEYHDTKGLRYGSLMIMTDQDFDGSHIKGLILNFIHTVCPTLLKVPGFMKEFVTPVVKVTKGEETKTFFTVKEYDEFKEETNGGKGWNCKYYKGLGTSTASEAKEYFAALTDHEIAFNYAGEEDENLIDMAFNSKRADDRKQWISACDDENIVDHRDTSLSYTDFVNKELVHFAKYDVQRMIPSMIDGFKPGQRKVMFGCFKRKLKEDFKVAQLSGYVSEHGAYHHGETSLQGTIIGMAQNFPGSNNINLLIPSGQFGTRLQGGKDHAAARYIYTRLSKVTRCIFPEEDDKVMEYLNDEGRSIEPKWYCPVIPMVLVNGAEGIAVGWATSVPNYNPREIIANVRHLLKGEQLTKMTPWYRGFKGTIAQSEPGSARYDTTGISVKRGRTRLEITELPIKKWTQDYKEWLQEQMTGDRKAMLTELREYHTDNSVHFVCTLTPDKLAEAERKGIEKSFHLRSSVSTSNMMMFNEEGIITKYESAEDVLRAFFPVRLDMYKKRKANILRVLEVDLKLIDNRLRFILLVLEGKLEVERRKAKDLCADMRRKGLQTKAEINGLAMGADFDETGKDGYKYLLSMKMWNLTDEKVEELRRQQQTKKAEVEEMQATKVEVLWERDLAKLDDALDSCDRDELKEQEASAKLARKRQKDNDNEDDLQNKQCVLVMTSDYRIKRVRTSAWKSSRRGKALSANKGLLKKKKAVKVEEAAVKEDEVEKEEGDAQEEEEDEAEPESLAGVFVCHDFDALLVFSEHGFMYMLQALDVPLAKTSSAQGALLKDLLPELGDKHIVTALVPVSHVALREQSDEFLVLVSAQGFAKKITISKFRGVKPGKGAMCFKLQDGDTLRWGHKADATCALVVVTETGMLIRTSLGMDWNESTPKGIGRPAIKMKQGSGDSAAGSHISKMTAKEIEDVTKNCQIRQAKKEAAAAKRAAAVASGVTVEDSGAGPEKPKKAPGCDDDDSDNGEAKLGEEADVEEADDADEKDEDDKESAGEDSDAEKADVKEGQGDEDKAEEVVPSQQGPSALVVTADGMSLRLPLTHKKLKLKRRGGRGLKAIKLLDDDEVVSVTVLGSQESIVEPQAAKATVVLWLGDNKAEIEKEVHAQFAASAAQDSLAADDDKQTRGPPQPVGFEMARAVKRLADSRFEALSDDVRAPYVLRAEEDKTRYDLEKKAFQQLLESMPLDEVLVGSKNGSVNRIKVYTIPFTKGINKGKKLVNIKGDDKLCVVTLITTAEVEADDDDEQAQADASATGADMLMEQDDNGELAPPIRWKSPAVIAAEAAAAKAAALAKAQAIADGDHPMSGTPGSKEEGPGRRVRGKTGSPQIAKLSPLARTISRISPMARKSSSGSLAEVKRTVEKAKAGAKGRGGGASPAPKKGGRGQKKGK